MKIYKYDHLYEIEFDAFVDILGYEFDETTYKYTEVSTGEREEIEFKDQTWIIEVNLDEVYLSRYIKEKMLEYVSIDYGKKFDPYVRKISINNISKAKYDNIVVG